MSAAYVGSDLNTMPAGMSSWTSVPAVALLEILSTPPILAARSRIPAKPQCPPRPFSSTWGSIPHPLSRIRMRSPSPEYSSSNSTRFAPEWQNALTSASLPWMARRIPEFAPDGWHLSR